jgi:hypothetical protein
MSRHELVSAFLEGRITRRTLVRRLVAGGVSTGAAVSYAQMLQPEQAMGASSLVIPGDHYPMVDLSITSTSLATVRSEAKLQVTTVGTEELLNVGFAVFVLTTTGGVLIGTKFIPSFLAKANNRRDKLPINIAPFAGQTSVRFYVQASGHDAENYPTIASAAATLS